MLAVARFGTTCRVYIGAHQDARVRVRKAARWESEVRPGVTRHPVRRREDISVQGANIEVNRLHKDSSTIAAIAIAITAARMAIEQFR